MYVFGINVIVVVKIGYFVDCYVDMICFVLCWVVDKCDVGFLGGGGLWWQFVFIK